MDVGYLWNWHNLFLLYLEKSFVTIFDEIDADSPIPDVDIAVTATCGEGVVVPAKIGRKNKTKNVDQKVFYLWNEMALTG